ncbi:DUF3644 domain-containing protein [Mucilaginibacter sp. ZT4R22]|uniref:DUF3644 domain-containing protein n=1 Tax=Mucilaginibacter pankratovii TaxID=2772110 RepID=A0ABR7WQ55_9SPHI|nr:DUF3644 domain-containing protein [Mucilaginibacter pankratovii]MBD1364435.1 DUF3644 domain-containing protein [Mucilaginibacter pankratovii]
MSKLKRVWSIKEELLTKSREAMLNAVQTFNNPNIKFKSESFIVLSVIAWTYLLHAYYRDRKLEYRYHKINNNRKRFDKTKRGAFKFWELERCLDDNNCTINDITKANLKFLIGLRHEIEHQMTSKIDDYLSARFQACCVNYNTEIKELFDPTYGIDKHLSFSLQFSSICEDHVRQLRTFEDLPPNIASYINAFDNDLSDTDFNDIRYSYRVLFLPKTVNNKGQADRVIEFIKADSPEAKKLNTEYVFLKDSEKKKYLPHQICNEMQTRGFVKFKIHHHTVLWKDKNAKAKGKTYGVQIDKMWYWYQTWFDIVVQHCAEHAYLYVM